MCLFVCVAAFVCVYLCVVACSFRCFLFRGCMCLLLVVLGVVGSLCMSAVVVGDVCAVVGCMFVRLIVCLLDGAVACLVGCVCPFVCWLMCVSCLLSCVMVVGGDGVVCCVCFGDACALLFVFVGAVAVVCVVVG